MYNNGEKVKGYARKQLHKDKMKKKYAKHFLFYDSNEATYDQLLIYMEEKKKQYYIRPYYWFDANKPIPYWKNYYISNRREYARHQTKRKIRSITREELANMNLEDVVAPRSSYYQKVFDYNWTVF